jgi:hypothetical protein
MTERELYDAVPDGAARPSWSRRRLAVVLVAVVVAAAAVVTVAVALSGDDEPPPSDDTFLLRREHIIFAVEEGKLPPIALRIYPGTLGVDPNFIDGPRHGRDIVHTRGARGPKLQWDLNRDGRISRAERTITEEELYLATMRYRDCYRC